MATSIVFGQYELLEKVAKGGMAEVWRARLKNSSEILAVKRILPEISADNEFITMFLNEAKIALQLQHPGVIKMRELGEVQGSYFLAMEYIAGQSMRTILDKTRAATKAKAWTLNPLFSGHVVLQAAEALDYVHKKKDSSGRSLEIVHRDVSPENLLVGYDGQVKLIDFGIAKAAAKASSQTRVGLIKGKLAYLSPEQSRSLPLDGRSDVFALGAVFYELLTGKSLFLGDSEFDTVANVRDMVIPKPSAAHKGVSPELDAIILKALQRDLSLRYQSAGDMAADLRALLQKRSPFTQGDIQELMRETFPDEWGKEQRVAAELAATPVAPLPRSSPSGIRAPGVAARPTPGPSSAAAVARPTPKPPVVPGRPATIAPWTPPAPPTGPQMDTVPLAGFDDFSDEKTELASKLPGMGPAAPTAKLPPSAGPAKPPPAAAPKRPVKANPMKWAILGGVVAALALVAFLAPRFIQHGKGFLVVNASPAQAAVTIDGEPETEHGVVHQVDEGPHDIEVEAPGFETLHKQVFVAAGSTSTVEAPLVFSK